MSICLRRREFIAGLSGAAAAWPLAARAQQATRTLIGYLSPGTPAGDAASIAGFRKGLSEMGWGGDPQFGLKISGKMALGSRSLSR